jgi:hypothetical protein
LNKIYYQSSTFVAAFAQMMANKGFVMNDANIGTLEAVLSNVLTTADTKTPLITIPFSPTLTIDCSKANGFEITLTGNITTLNLINFTVGQTLLFIFIQSGAGNFTVAAPTQGNAFLDWLQPNAASGAVTAIPYICRIDGTIRAYEGYINLLLGQLNSTNSSIAALQSGKQNNLGFTPVQQGTGISQSSSPVQTVKLGLSLVDTTAPRLRCTINVTDFGDIVTDTQLNPVSTGLASLSGTVSGIQSQQTVMQGQINGIIAAFANSLTSPGWQKFEGGLIIQWGKSVEFNTGPITVNFPLVFPNACLWAIAGSFRTSADRITSILSFNTTGVTIQNSGDAAAQWFAIGH